MQYLYDNEILLGADLPLDTKHSFMLPAYVNYNKRNFNYVEPATYLRVMAETDYNKIMVLQDLPKTEGVLYVASLTVSFYIVVIDNFIYCILFNRQNQVLLASLELIGDAWSITCEDTLGLSDSGRQEAIGSMVALHMLCMNKKNYIIRTGVKRSIDGVKVVNKTKHGVIHYVPDPKLRLASQTIWKECNGDWVLDNSGRIYYVEK